MTWYPSERALKELVTDLIDTDDPVLYGRAYDALGALLADDASNTD